MIAIEKKQLFMIPKGEEACHTTQGSARIGQKVEKNEENVRVRTFIGFIVV